MTNEYGPCVASDVANSKDDTDAVIARSTALVHVAKRERAPAHASEVDRRRQELAEREGFEPSKGF